MSFPRLFLLVSAIVLLVGCNGSITDPTDLPSDGSSDPTGGNTTLTGDPGLTGQLKVPAGTKRVYAAKEGMEGYQVVAQSDATGTIYRGTTDAAGTFTIDIPDSESGNTFMITILGPDGKAIGPVLFGTAGADGITGLKVTGEASLGTIELPADPNHQTIEPGDDANVSGQEDTDVTARLNGEGVPVGLDSKGKGQAAQYTGTTTQPSNSEGQADPDKDGLIDLFDADDNGNGTVDDFDGDGNVGSLVPDIHVNFFMNLKVQSEEAAAFYSGTEAERNEALARLYVITLEAFAEPFSTRVIKSMTGLETPGPAYLPTAEASILNPSGAGWNRGLWSSAGYAFLKEPDRFDVWVFPNTVMESGDTFNVNIEFEDGTSEQYTRMINYVFKNIPKLLQYGSVGNLKNFSITDTAANGTGAKPIRFDGTKDLVLVFNPPPDETGASIQDLD